MMIPTPYIRHAVEADAKALAELAERTFRETFASMNTVDDMEQHCRQSYSEELQRAEISSDSLATLVCEYNGQLIAFAQLRWADAPSCVEGSKPGEIQRLYVAKEWHGKGAAQHLMTACLAELEKRHVDVAWLGVWEKNPRAISFYRKCGFIEVGNHVFPLGTDLQTDIVMIRALRTTRTTVNIAIPILLSRSIGATMAFYAKLGFTGRADDSYAMLRRGDIELHFSLYKELIPEQSNAMCYLRVDNVDALHQEISKARLPQSGIPRMDSVENKPWGMREFAIVDEDGNLIRIGQQI